MSIAGSSLTLLSCSPLASALSRRKQATLLALVAVTTSADLAAQSGDWIAAQRRISSTRGSFTGTLNDGDVFGIDTAPLGDLDGDGVPDIAVGAQFDDDGGVDQGAVWILYLQSNGSVKSHAKISETAGGFSGTLQPGDLFGNSLANLGDLDGNGTVDLAVASLWDDDGGTDRGAVWILFLEADGSVLTQTKISSTAGGFTGALDDGDWFGGDLDSLGDLDGDGIQDLVVGCPKDDDGGPDRGAVWILYLNADGTVKSHSKISHTSGGFASTLQDGDELGDGVELIGDLNGDGFLDLAAGAHADDDTGEHSGSVWVLFLDGSQRVIGQQKISGTVGGFQGSLDPWDIFGLGLNTVPDLDGDGVRELAVGAILDDDGGMDAGAFWILFLEPDGTVRDQVKVSELSGGFSGNLQPGAHFGRPRCIGDVNGDGVEDLVLGATGTDDGGDNRGAIWVAFLNRCESAGVVQRNGSGQNPLILTAQDAPVPGAIWNLHLDAGAHAPSVFSLEGRGLPAAGTFFPAGELLIDLTSGLVARLTRPHAGGSTPIAIPVPQDVSLCGRTAHFQSVVLGAPRTRLSNALDATVGEP